MPKSSDKLIPPDKNRCQALKPNGATFMTLGGRPELIQCTNKPVVIATERKPSSDGQVGSMSLCAACQEKMLAQLGPEFATFKKITADKPAKLTKRDLRVIKRVLNSKCCEPGVDAVLTKVEKLCHANET